MEDQRVPLGVSVEENDAGFAIRHRDENGRVDTLRLTKGEMLGLMDELAWRRKELTSGGLAGSTSANPIVAAPIATYGLLPDSLGEDVILTVEAPTGEQMSLQIPKPVAQHLAQALHGVLAAMQPPVEPRQ